MYLGSIRAAVVHRGRYDQHLPRPILETGGVTRPAGFALADRQGNYRAFDVDIRRELTTRCCQSGQLSVRCCAMAYTVLLHIERWHALGGRRSQRTRALFL